MKKEVKVFVYFKKHMVNVHQLDRLAKTGLKDSKVVIVMSVIKKRSGQPKKLQDKELEALRKENGNHTS